jgi:DNA processing protein
MNPGNNSEALLPTTPNMLLPFVSASGMPGVQVLEIGAPAYPARLAGLKPAARTLWLRGRLPAGGPALAVVGSRAASRAGCERAHELTAAAARAGWAVISGGAFGIDAAAHRGALAGGGETAAVLGCGVDVVYPDRHAALFAELAEKGGLLSELPPGTAPRPGQFPARNRIIAALSDAVLVVEAAARSGALITARFGREIGLRLLAVPGSAGTDRLLADGAQAVTDASSLFDALAGRPTAAPSVAITGAYAALIAALRERGDTPAGLAQRLGSSLPAVMGLLMEAELEGWVRRAAGNHYEVSIAD